MPRLLVLVADEDLRTRLVALGERLGHAALGVRSMKAAQAALAEGADLIFFDLEVGTLEGLKLVADRDAITIAIATSGSALLGLDAARAGAYDLWLTAGVHAASDWALSHSITSALNARLSSRRSTPMLTLPAEVAFVIGPSMQELVSRLGRIARSVAPVHIHGETGTGKELLTKAIHNLSPRASGPLVTVNCSAVPKDLIESELFGHEKGAFTGAVKQRIGRFEQAHQGTLFLDEIGEVSQDVQVKLLRVLQEQTIERVGSGDTIKVDVRIISATNRDLQQQVECGAFRQDLFYRLNVIPVRVPPLRDRRGDIPALAQHFIDRQKNTTGIDSLSPEAEAVLCAHRWPGNVRELENAIEVALVSATPPQVAVKDLPTSLLTTSPEAEALITDEALGLRDAVAAFERAMLVRAYEGSGRVISDAARRLRVLPSELLVLLSRHGLK